MYVRGASFYGLCRYGKSQRIPLSHLQWPVLKTLDIFNLKYRTSFDLVEESRGLIEKYRLHPEFCQPDRYLRQRFRHTGDDQDEDEHEHGDDDSDDDGYRYDSNNALVESLTNRLQVKEILFPQGLSRNCQ